MNQSASVVRLYGSNEGFEEDYQGIPGGRRHNRATWAPSHIPVQPRASEILSNGYTVAQQRALALAEQENFQAQCSALLWGSESAAELWDVAQGVILEFLPASRWELEQLTSIVEWTWKLRRIRLLQRELFSNSMAGVTEAGLPRRTARAMSLDEDAGDLQKRLASAIKLYRGMKSYR